MGGLSINDFDQAFRRRITRTRLTAPRPIKARLVGSGTGAAVMSMIPSVPLPILPCENAVALFKFMVNRPAFVERYAVPETPEMSNPVTALAVRPPLRVA